MSQAEPRRHERDAQLHQLLKPIFSLATDFHGCGVPHLQPWRLHQKKKNPLTPTLHGRNTRLTHTPHASISLQCSAVVENIGCVATCNSKLPYFLEIQGRRVRGNTESEVFSWSLYFPNALDLCGDKLGQEGNVDGIF